MLKGCEFELIKKFYAKMMKIFNEIELKFFKGKSSLKILFHVLFNQISLSSSVIKSRDLK